MTSPRLRRATAAVAGLAAAAAVLAACASDDPIPTEAPTTTAEPIDQGGDDATNEPQPSESPVPNASDIVLYGAGFDIIGLEGDVIFRHEWVDEVGPAVEALTEAFASSPLENFEEGDGAHFADAQIYTWGTGFNLGDAVNLMTPRAEYFQPSFLYVQVADVNGVEIRTSSGLQVGSALADVLAVDAAPSPDSEGWYMVDAADPALLGSPNESTQVVSVRTADDAVIGLFAPFESLPF